MKKILLFCFLAGFLTVAFTNDAYAQRGKKKKSSKTDEYFDESGNFASKLWYGANIGNLGGFGGTFNVNLSPFVGYEFLPNASVGVITKFNYLFQSFGNTVIGGQNTRVTLSALDFSYGAFARYKVFNVAFVGAELEQSGFTRLRGGFLQVDNDGNVLTQRESEPYFYLGGGYSNSNGVWGYELAIYYNILDDPTYVRIPWDLRVGITYKF